MHAAGTAGLTVVFRFEQEPPSVATTRAVQRFTRRNWLKQGESGPSETGIDRETASYVRSLPTEVFLQIFRSASFLHCIRQHQQPIAVQFTTRQDPVFVGGLGKGLHDRGSAGRIKDNRTKWVAKDVAQDEQLRVPVMERHPELPTLDGMNFVRHDPRYPFDVEERERSVWVAAGGSPDGHRLRRIGRVALTTPTAGPFGNLLDRA